MATHTCEKCGAELTRKDKRCPECGCRIKHIWRAMDTAGLLFIIAVIYIAMTEKAQMEERSFCSAAKYDLANVALYQEDFHARNQKFADTIKSLEQFKPSEGVIVKIAEAGKDGFVATASHPDCDLNGDGGPDIFKWNSADGGLKM